MLKKQYMKRKNKPPERPFTPNAQQFEKAFNIISNIENYNMPTFKNMVESSSLAELKEMLKPFTLKGCTTMVERIKRIAEHTGELQTLVGLRNHLVSAITILQDKFSDNLVNEYPCRHGLVDTRKIREDLKIQLGIRAATAPCMSDG
jgi:hypothetical protein